MAPAKCFHMKPCSSHAGMQACSQATQQCMMQPCNHAGMPPCGHASGMLSPAACCSHAAQLQHAAMQPCSSPLTLNGHPSAGYTYCTCCATAEWLLLLQRVLRTMRTCACCSADAAYMHCMSVVGPPSAAHIRHQSAAHTRRYSQPTASLSVHCLPVCWCCVITSGPSAKAALAGARLAWLSTWCLQQASSRWLEQSSMYGQA
jgi:hypothetical protein